jgi:hypothetical protein
VKIANPVAGKISGSVIVKVHASDNMGPAGIALSIYVDGVNRASGPGNTMAYTWDASAIVAGSQTLYAVPAMRPEIVVCTRYKSRSKSALRPQ